MTGTRTRVKCDPCGGTGRLSPIGYDGLAADAVERRDVKRNFPRTCEGCGGAGWRFIVVDVQERGGTGTANG